MAEDLRQATETLIRKHPNRMPTHYYNALRATMDGQWVTAEKEIKKAESLGLPPEVAEEFLGAGVRRRARIER